MTLSNPPSVDLEKGPISPANSNKFSEASTLRPEIKVKANTPTRGKSGKAINDLARKAVIRKVEDKFRGYSSLSTFLDSDENFMIYRRFGYLHSRVLLRIQDQLRKLEQELDRYDKEDADAAEKGSEQSRKLLMSRDLDEAADRRELKANPDLRTRTQILNDIEQCLEKYDSFIEKAQYMASLSKPAARDYASVEGYIFDKKPLLDEEASFIYRREDLITLRDGREAAFLDAATEKMLQASNHKWLKKIFCTEADLLKTDDLNLHYYSKTRRDYFTTSIIVFILLALLILPVLALYKLTMTHQLKVTYAISIGVLLVFTLAFSGVLSVFTKAKRHEIFMAAAGYCAVLVVFISNIPNAK
ncbi:hypothetical protein BGZ60DRAFT_428633 [Tricladium varicosporioides]|nr:hypothetical protein BGZ60DRAFT_428633 [Hymenoscyphus varicosporioides]